MKKKIFLYIIISIITVLFAFTINKLFNSNNKEKRVTEIAEKVTDECTEEYEEMLKTAEASTNNEKITPNTVFVMQKHYKDCDHIIQEKVELPQDIINMTKSELQNEYKDWNIEKFTEDEVIISKDYAGECDEHYILRDNDGIIAIYKIDKNGNERLLDETEIATEYLTESDLTDIQDGIKVNGKEQLNKMLEDFE